MVNYESHYNARLNQYFLLETATTYQKREGRATSTKSMRIFDLNSKKYGTFVRDPLRRQTWWISRTA